MFGVDNKSKDLCTVATPWGLFCNKQPPVGALPSPDIAQETMERVLAPLLKELEVCFDDIAAFSDDWDSHLVLFEKSLTTPQEKGFTVNPAKCEWGIQELFCHWLVPEGVRLWHKKIDVVFCIEAPANIKELCSFLGKASHCCDMWSCHAQVLAPLTALVESKDFHQGPEQQHAFSEMKVLVATDALLVCPHHNQGFDIKMDASDCQLGMVTKQNG